MALKTWYYCFSLMALSTEEAAIMARRSPRDRRTAAATAPTARLGGPIAFRGRVFETADELEQALAEAVGAAGWRLTPRGEGYLTGYAEAQREGAA
jgi:hypothetical protein